MIKKVLLKSPLLGISGYSFHSRIVLDVLMSRSDLFDVYVLNINWGKTGWIDQRSQEHEQIIALIQKTSQFLQEGGKFDLSIQITIPNEFERIAPVNIGITAGIETNKVAPEWLEKANMMDKLIVVSNFAKEGFVRTTYRGQNPQGQEVVLRLLKEIDVVGFPVNESKPDPEILKYDFGTEFNFLTVCQWGPRKNLHNLVGWFLEEFQNENIGLVIKTSFNNNSMIDKYNVEAQIQQILNKFPNRKCKIHLFHGDMTDSEMMSLNQHPQIKSYLCTSFGEGFNVPMFDAACNGMPVVTTDWSGYQDYMYMEIKGKFKPAFAKVDYELAPVQKEVLWSLS